MIPQATITRYRPGGDIYAKLVSQYGTSNADFIARAALTGERAQLTEAIAQVRNGEALSTNTTAIFLNQLITDPLDAPADMVSKAVDNVGKALKSPVTYVVIGGLVLAGIAIYATSKNR